MPRFNLKLIINNLSKVELKNVLNVLKVEKPSIKIAENKNESTKKPKVQLILKHSTSNTGNEQKLDMNEFFKSSKLE